MSYPKCGREDHPRSAAWRDIVILRATLETVCELVIATGDERAIAILFRTLNKMENLQNDRSFRPVKPHEQSAEKGMARVLTLHSTESEGD